jgi:hypothetical protein
LRIIALILGLLTAAIGGTVAYRALFLAPPTTFVITGSDVHELPNTARLVTGIALLVLGASVAFFAARRKPM